MPRRVRRFWSDHEKRRIVAQSYAPGVSVSVVARRYDVNANMIFTWRRGPRYKPAVDAEEAPSYLPVEVVSDPPAEPVAASDGRIEIALSNGHRVWDATVYSKSGLPSADVLACPRRRTRRVLFPFGGVGRYDREAGRSMQREGAER